MARCWLHTWVIAVVIALTALTTTTRGSETVTATDVDKEQTCRNNDDGSRTCQEQPKDGTVSESLRLVQPQIEWIREEGGFVNSKVQVQGKTQNTDGAVGGNNLGWFAVQPIPMGELILSIPPDCVIVPALNDRQVANGMFCNTIRSLIREFERGDKSFYAPYVNFLKSLPPGRLPSAWSDHGKELLVTLIGDLLPPDDPVGWLDNEWTHDCRGSSIPLDHHAAMLVVQREWDGILIPLLDMINHRRGYWENARHNALDFDGQEHIVVTAARNIGAGEEIYTNYHSNTPEILRDTGMVESYPQSWVFRGNKVSFGLDRTTPRADEEEKEGDLNDVTLVWRKEPLTDIGVIEEFQEERLRLRQFAATYLKAANSSSARPSTIPESEWNVIVAFHRAAVMAVERVLQEVRPLHQDNCAVSSVMEEDDCRPTPGRYSRHTLTVEFDDGFHKTDTCDQEKQLDHSHYTTLEKIQSPYQRIAFLEDPANRDMCFSLGELPCIYRITVNIQTSLEDARAQFNGIFY